LNLNQLIEQQQSQLKGLKKTMDGQMSAFASAVAEVTDEKKKNELLRLKKEIENAIATNDLEKVQKTILKLQGFGDILNK